MAENKIDLGWIYESEKCKCGWYKHPQWDGEYEFWTECVNPDCEEEEEE